MNLTALEQPPVSASDVRPTTRGRRSDAPREGKRERRRRARILLVEDNPGDARLVRENLRDAALGRFDLVHVSTMADAEEALADDAFDAVLLDLSLPDAAGLPTVSRALAAAPGVPVIVLTGLEDEAVGLRAVHAGAQDFLFKHGATGAVISRALRYALERKRFMDTQRFLAVAGARLADSLDYRTTLQHVADMATPLLADWCVTYVVDGATIHRVAAAHADPRQRETVRALGEDRVDLTPGHPVRRVLETGESLLSPEVSHSLLEQAAEDEAHLQALERLGMTSLIITPLVARGRTLGAIAFVASNSGRRFGEDDLVLAEELASRVALAVDNARLYEAQQVALERAEEAVRSRDEVLGIVAHDLRNPLSSVRMAAYLLLETELPENRREEFLRSIVSNTERIDRQIEDLLEVARLEGGGLRIESERHRPHALVLDALETLGSAAAAKEVEIEVQAGDGLPQVMADPDRIRQVFVNLCGNALKLTPAGGRIRISAAEIGPFVRFSVADSGPGMREEDIPHLFDRFWQSRPHRKGGAGLGLSIARGIVEAHGGEIHAENGPEGGALFHFTIPVAGGTAGSGA